MLASRYDLVHLKRIAFVIALTSCLSLGSIMLFSLFASALHNVAGLTYTQINSIVSFSAVGMYLCLPILGYMADCYGPALLSLISIWAFCPAYLLNAYLVKLVSKLAGDQKLGESAVVVMAVSFWLIGLATSSLYFSSLITCAKIYPKHKSMAISLPVTCYGLSSLIGSQIMKLKYFHAYKNELDLYKVFLFFAVLYFAMGVLNFILNSIVSIEQDVIFGEEEPLISESEPTSEVSSLLTITPHRSAVEPVDHKHRFVSFLKDKSAWMLLVSLIFNVGPLESFQNNLGLILLSTTAGKITLSDQVSVMAALSTATRLLVGVAADWISSEDRKVPISKIWLLLLLVLVGAVGQVAVLFRVPFSWISVLSGISYGGIFTIYPTVVASVWGVDLMGSTWGAFMVAPAIGSILFSLFHGARLDLCPTRGVYVGGDNDGCLNGYFLVAASCLIISAAVIVVVWRLVWWRRGIRTF